MAAQARRWAALSFGRTDAMRLLRPAIRKQGAEPLSLGCPLSERAVLSQLPDRAYGVDVRLPGMLHAVVARSPVFGGRLVAQDAAPALAVDGVRYVVPIDNAVDSGFRIATFSDMRLLPMRIASSASGIPWPRICSEP